MAVPSTSQQAISSNIHQHFLSISGPTKADFLRWLASRDLIPSKRTCECGQEMELKRPEEFTAYFVCPRKHLHADGFYKVFSRFLGTIFEAEDVCPYAIIFLMLCRSKRLSIADSFTKAQLVNLHIPISTICKYFKLIDAAVFTSIIEDGHYEQEFNPPIGGVNVVVELSMVAFKNPRSYLFAMTEYGRKNYRVALVQDSNVDIKFLHEIIEFCVMPGTIIFTERAQEYTMLDTSKWYRFTDDFSPIPFGWNKIRFWHFNDPFQHSEAGRFCYFLLSRNVVFNGITIFDEFINIISKTSLRF